MKVFFREYSITKDGLILSPSLKPIKTHVSKSGYESVVLKDANRKSVNFLVHRILAEAFIPNPENKPQVNHIDADKLNNNLSNLQWVNPSENIQHSLKRSPELWKRRGNPQNFKAFIGESHWNTKLNKDAIICIRSCFDKGVSIKTIASAFKISRTNVRRIINRITWKEVP
jgi:hypothetical protein